MATGSRRDEIDAKIKGWEGELEKLRLALARAPEAEEAKHRAAFIELYRKKEIAKSRWQCVKGVYLPEAEALRQCEDALADMETAWSAARPLLAGIREAATV